jgi:hypothetical protein
VVSVGEIAASAHTHSEDVRLISGDTTDEVLVAERNRVEIHGRRAGHSRELTWPLTETPPSVITAALAGTADARKTATATGNAVRIMTRSHPRLVAPEQN